jgi:ABC-type dipeptide/oligopeptide/nickel transport system permease component
MLTYAVRRVLLLIPTLFFVALLTFVLARIAPGSPFDLNPDRPLTAEQIARLNRTFGLDRPLHEQFALYISNAVRLDFGSSIVKDRPVAEVIGQGFGVTAQLGIQALALALLVAFPLGIVSAVRQNGAIDYVSLLLVTIGTTIPSFVIAIFFIYLFGVQLKALPFVGWGDGLDLRRMIMPTVILSLGPAAFLTRIVRASMLEAIRQDYVRTARGKGLRETAVITRHAMRNALIPAVTIIGPVTAGLIAGSFIIETLFSIPGIGREYIRSINARDYPLIMATTLLYAFLISVANLTVDLVYGAIDPRIKVAR